MYKKLIKFNSQIKHSKRISELAASLHLSSEAIIK